MKTCKRNWRNLGVWGLVSRKIFEVTRSKTPEGYGGDAPPIKILRRVSQDKRIIEHNRTKLYTLQQDRKQVSK